MRLNMHVGFSIDLQMLFLRQRKRLTFKYKISGMNDRQIGSNLVARCQLNDLLALIESLIRTIHIRRPVDKSWGAKSNFTDVSRAIEMATKLLKKRHSYEVSATREMYNRKLAIQMDWLKLIAWQYTARVKKITEWCNIKNSVSLEIFKDNITSWLFMSS